MRRTVEAASGPVATPTAGGPRCERRPYSHGMRSRTVPVPVPLDLGATLRPLTLAWGRRDHDGWWRPMRTPDGPGTLLVSRSGAGVHAHAWGPGADWALARVERLVGVDDPAEEFTTDHPVVGPLVRARPGWRIGCTGLVMDALVTAVVAQKVTGKEAARGLRGLARRFSERAPGPHPALRLPPDPDAMAAAPYHAYHDLGIEKRRADVLRRVAADARRIERLAALPADRAGTYLRRFRGVGPWTVAETMVVTHGDPDAVSVGDHHLKHVVVWHLTGRPRGTDEEMLALLEQFRPHRARVVRLLEAEGGAPRFGPRMPLRDFDAPSGRSRRSDRPRRAVR